ncbi:MAG: nicotinate-nucleotide diphosphorylase, partial [Glaciecola sp.]|nr:nicotinate-nucleotide diphosphorylase [Glaciecola sp.]
MSNIDPSSPLASSHYPQHLASDTLIPMSIIQQDVEQALAEDLGVLSQQHGGMISNIASNDITAQLIPA